MSDESFLVRKWVKPGDLNQHGSLAGARLLHWLDEEAAILATVQLGTISVVTRYISEVAFVSSAVRGDMLELDYRIVAFGRTSVTFSCVVMNAVTGREVFTVDRIVFVSVDDAGMATPHGRSAPVRSSARLREPFPAQAESVQTESVEATPER